MLTEQDLNRLQQVLDANKLGEHELNDQERNRIESLKKLIEMGINPFPAEKFEVTAFAANVKADFKDEEANPENKVTLAGRLMSRREMGKASFAELQDSTGRIQLYIKREHISNGDDMSMYDQVFKHLLDIGDFIGVQGYVFRTKMGEVSIHVEKLTFLSKTIRTLPIVKKDADGNIFDEFKDPELRYRQRYVDLTVNPQFKQIFLRRTKLIKTMRQFFDDHGWLEVETPILQPIHGGAAARPFRTHHNTLDMQLYLRIANELYLKRLIVGGFDGVYEFGKMFRNEGMDRTHNPEFTSMEMYVAYKDYVWMMSMTERLLATVATALHGKTQVEFQGNVLEFGGEYEKLSMYDSIKKYTGVDVSSMNEEQLRQLCREWRIEIDGSMGVGKLIDEIFSEKVEHHLIQPTFITDHPLEMTPLAKKHRSKEGLVERFELFVMGKEIANAYSELNDPIDQRERFVEQLELANRGDEEAMAMDEDFVRCLEYGMPPTAGLGIGIDRLTMLMTNNVSIQEVLFFPQMRPEKEKIIHTIKDKTKEQHEKDEKRDKTSIGEEIMDTISNHEKPLEKKGTNVFGGFWTEKKIKVFIRYLKAYLEIMKKQEWADLTYFDGFAGCGEIESTFDCSFIEGTATQVLELYPKMGFDRYYLVELDKKKAESLSEKLKNRFNNCENKIYVVAEDCNKKLKDFAQYIKEKKNRRGLSFIDPFGMEVDWHSLSNFKDASVDMWILVPTGIGVNRLLKKDGEISEAGMKKLEKFLGVSEEEIQKEFYSKTPTLFDEKKLSKVENAIQKIAVLYKKQMETVWKFVSDPMPLRNSMGSVMYHFIFASQVPIAQKIANEIIGKELASEK